MFHFFSLYVNRLFLSLIILFCSISILYGVDSVDYIDSHNNRGVSINSSYINNIIDQMTIREKIAQIMILSFNCDVNNKNTKETIELIKSEKIGGVIIMNSRLEEGVEMINFMQSISKKIPLLVTIDGEWGASMRFHNILSFPRQMQLGSLSSDSLVYQMGRAIGEQLNRLGFHVNYAPTIDINNNPNNPVINTRAFGEDKDIVTNYGLAYMKGMQDLSIATSAKHFPGHGDTDIDSHMALPLLPFDKLRLDSLELYPFRRLIQHGVDMVMVGHLQVPSLDSSGTPSSISKKIVTDILKNELEYNGIIITDALNMKGVADHLPAEQIPLEAYKAGCDILLMPENVQKAISIIEEAVNLGEISEHSLNMRVKKMLILKDRLGILSDYKKIEKKNLIEDLNNNRFKSLVQDISDNSITIVQNRNNIVPISELKYQDIGYLSLDINNGQNGSHLAKRISKYIKIDSTILKGDISIDSLIDILDDFENKSLIILAVHNTDFRPQKDFGLDKNHFDILEQFSKGRDVILCYFGNPLALSKMDNLEYFSTVIIGYTNTIENNNSVASIILGSHLSKGKLPLATANFGLRYGIETEIINKRVGYNLPEYYGIESQKIEDVIQNFINDTKDNGINSFHISILKENSIIYNKQTSDVINLDMVKGYISTIPIISYLTAHNYISLEDFVNKYLEIDRDSIYYNSLISDVIMNRVYNINEDKIYPKYKESNSIILENIIEKITNTSIQNLIQTNLLNAIGMVSTFIDDKGAIYSSSEDIAKFIYIIQSEGKYGNCQIIDLETLNIYNNYSHYYTKGDNGTLIYNNFDKKSAITILIDAQNSNDLKIKSENLRRELSIIVDNIVE